MDTNNKTNPSPVSDNLIIYSDLIERCKLAKSHSSILNSLYMKPTASKQNKIYNRSNSNKSSSSLVRTKKPNISSNNISNLIRFNSEKLNTHNGINPTNSASKFIRSITFNKLNGYHNADTNKTYLSYSSNYSYIKNSIDDSSESNSKRSHTKAENQANSSRNRVKTSYTNVSGRNGEETKLHYRSSFRPSNTQKSQNSIDSPKEELKSSRPITGNNLIKNTVDINSNLPPLNKFYIYQSLDKSSPSNSNTNSNSNSNNSDRNNNPNDKKTLNFLSFNECLEKKIKNQVDKMCNISFTKYEAELVTNEEFDLNKIMNNKENGLYCMDKIDYFFDESHSENLAEEFYYDNNIYRYFMLFKISYVTSYSNRNYVTQSLEINKAFVVFIYF